MRCSILVLVLLASMTFSAHVVSAAGGHAVMQGLQVQQSPAEHARRMTGADAKQTVQSGAIRSASQLQEPISVYPSGFTVVNNSSIDPAAADGTRLGGLHTVTYEHLGMLFGWLGEAHKTLTDGTTFVLEYLGSAYTSPDAAVGAFNDAAGAWTNASSTYCTFPGADQCTDVVLPSAYLNQNGFPYSAVIRILQKSNSLWEGLYLLENDDFSANRSTGDQYMTSMANGYVALFNASTGPTATPTLPPSATTTPTLPPPATPTPTPKPTTTPTLQPTPTPTTTPVNTDFKILSVRIEKNGSKPDWTQVRPQLSTVTVGKTVKLAVYWELASAPANTQVTYTFMLRLNGKSLGKRDFPGTLNFVPNTDYENAVSYQASQPGKYVVTWRVTVNGKASQASASFTAVPKTQAPPPPAPVSFTFDKITVLDSNKLPRTAFASGQFMKIVATYTVHNVVHVVTGQVSFKFQTQDNGTGQFHTRFGDTVSVAVDKSGTTSSFHSLQSGLTSALPGKVTVVRIAIGISLGGSFKQKSLDIQVK